ncbi:DUF637 domain-containing protein, partial [Neisseria meningitidis]|uniref:DUF637 domain-containing protein n=1 Tax=Neisseria meningitidis TaxID=487 RepID=UPI001EFE1ABB
AGGRTTINDATIQAGSSVYSSTKGDTELGENTRIIAENVTVLSNGSIGSAAVIEAKDTAHIESGKPLSLETSTVASNIRLNNGNIKGGKQLALLADDNITAKTTNLNTPGNLYVHTGKDLNLNVDKDLSAASIHLKSDNAAHITGTSKTLTASKDMGVEAGLLNVTNTNLRTNSGNLHIQAAKGNIQLRNTKLNAAKALETTALQGNIVSDGLHAVSADGHVSLLANGNADFTGHNTLTAKADVNAGSVGKGRLKADNTNITSSSGDITLVAGNGIQLGDGKQRNSINGKHISIKNNGGNADLKNLNVHAKSGALNIHSDRALSIENTKLESTHNTHLNAQHERVTLNQVDAYAHRHLSITGSQIWQNDKLPSANKLVANGVLALNARYSQIADNTTLRAGAINLTAGTALVKRGNINWSTVSTKTLEDNAELKPLAGRLNIEAGSGTLTIEPANRISAHTDLSIKTGGKLLLSAKGGNAGAPSAQVSSLEAKGNIRLVTGETDLRGSKITAGKNLVVATTKGKLNIEAVNNSFSNYFPTQKAAELNQKSKELEQQIAQLKKSSPKSKLIPTLQEERDRLAFYIQAINKEVKGKKPKGKEYLQAKLSAQNIDLISAQGIEISGSDITASKKLNLHAAGVLPKAADSEAAAILIDGITDQYEIGKPTYKSHYDKAALNKPSRLTGRTGVSIHAAAALDDARIIIGASEIKAPSGSIDIKAHSDIVLEAGQNDAYTFLKTKGKSGKIIRKTKFTSTRDHLIMPAPVELTANGITLQAGGNIEANTTRFNAPAGKVTLVAGEELQLLAEEGIHKHELDVQKSRRFIGIKVGKSNYSKNELNETKLPVRVVAQTAATRSGWDTVLEGTEFKTTLAGADIQAGVGEKARVDAKIILKGIVNRIQSEEKLETNSTVWQKQAGRGSTIETLKLPSFESPTPPKLSAPGGYIVDIPKGNLKTEIEKLSKQPEYAYLKQLQVAKNINWNQVQLAYDKWDYKQEGLTGAGAAIIALAVTVVTSGAGTGAVLGLNGAAAAATDAAFASLASQASVSFINNKGDVGKTLKELGRSSTVKNLVVAAATAGVADKIGASALNNVSDKQWINNLTVNLANAGSAALINTAVNGGSLKDNLEANILAALVNTAHGEAASKIKQLDQHYIVHKIAHAIAGCAAAAANKGKCQDGAIGAAVGEIVGEALTNGKNPDTLTAKEREQILAYSKLVAGTVSGVVGGDVNAAANAAEVAVKNNQLSDKEGREFDNEMTACAKQNNPQLCRKNTVKKYQNVADKRLAASIAICTDISRSTECRTIRKQHLIDSRSLHSSWEAGLIGKDDEWYKLFSKSYTQADLALQSYHLNTAAKSWLQSGNTKPLSEWMSDQGYTLISGVNPRFIPIPRGFVKQNTPITNVKYPEGISFDTNLKRHLANADGFSQKQGIKGAHNRTNFMAELNSRGGRVKSETQTDIEGITRIKYEIPTLDRTGKPDGGFKEISSIKTVYNPKKFSDDKILQMAQNAASQGYSKASKIAQNERTKSISERKNVIQFSETFDGIKFRSYFDVNTGRITNIHPE